jgi:hypothetical protein
LATLFTGSFPLQYAGSVAGFNLIETVKPPMKVGNQNHVSAACANGAQISLKNRLAQNPGTNANQPGRVDEIQGQQLDRDGYGRANNCVFDGNCWRCFLRRHEKLFQCWKCFP